MELDHDSGGLEGLVLAGRYEGRELGRMSMAELIVLRSDLKGDFESLQLLETYLDSNFPVWRDDAKANEGGGLMPTLAFGIPGGESMAILLVAFIGLGVVPGPEMLTKNLDLVFSMVWIIVIANVVVTVIGLGITPWLARLPTLHANLMVPIVLSVCFVGAYATRGRIEDVLVAAVFGVTGYLMDKYRYSRANFVIGMVLALMIERNLHISLTLYGNDFLLDRPIALAMLVFVVVTAAIPFLRNWRRQRRADALT